MRRFSGIAATCLLAITGVVLAGDEVKSGLPVGEFVPAFNVRDITGPNAGKSLCYRCQYGARPVVTIFTRELTDNVKELVKQIDAKVGANKDAKMASFVVMITETPDAVEPKLEALAKASKIKNIPLTIVEGSAGPPEYKIAKDAETTVMMWVDQKVKVNHAYAKGQFDKKAIETLVAETKKILE